MFVFIFLILFLEMKDYNLINLCEGYKLGILTVKYDASIY